MLEALTLLALVVLFTLGYLTRSYAGTLVPGAFVVWAAIEYEQKTPTDDEIGVLYAAFLIASVMGVLIYLAGVALGRRLRRRAPNGA